jgi:hypothetical protein
MRSAILLIVLLVGCADAHEPFEPNCGYCSDFGLFDPEAVFSAKCSFGYLFCCETCDGDGFCEMNCVDQPLVNN